jgi:hypothetical protein
MGNPEIKKGVCVYDLHYPQHNSQLWQNILNLVGDLQPDYFLFGGDNLDMEAVNHWEIGKGNKRGMEGKRLRKSYDGFNVEIMDKINFLLPSHCRKIWLYGNHEEWIERYIDKSPELEGFAEIERNIDLTDWEKYKYRELAKIGKLYFTHGDSGGKYHSNKMLEMNGCCITYGHFHTVQSFTKVTAVQCNAQMATSMPCACEINPNYMKNKPSAWVNGFGVFYIQPNGNFNVYPVISVKGHFIFNGIYY